VSLLELREVTLKFAGLTALDAVSLAVPKGSVFAVIGPNGAGKTSLFNCISGVYRPTAGGVSLAGESLLGLPPHAGRLDRFRTLQEDRRAAAEAPGDGREFGIRVVFDSQGTRRAEHVVPIGHRTGCNSGQRLRSRSAVQGYEILAH
jgi:ABC-type branched-subunit amino acid transport system ATPase component